jgi:hypothetical protein
MVVWSLGDPDTILKRELVSEKSTCRNPHSERELPPFQDFEFQTLQGVGERNSWSSFVEYFK